MWEDNIRMDLGEIFWEVVYWMRLAQDSIKWRVIVKTALRVP